jgi:hypothetical protein
MKAILNARNDINTVFKARFKTNPYLNSGAHITKVIYGDCAGECTFALRFEYY